MSDLVEVLLVERGEVKKHQLRHKLETEPEQVLALCLQLGTLVQPLEQPGGKL